MFAALATGLGLTALQASAQQARFHLPFEAHWGNTVLEPGDYELALSASEPIPILHLSGDSKSIMVMSMLTGIKPTSNRSFIQLVNVNGSYFVKQYESGSTGKVFSYRVPKMIDEPSAASSGATAIAFGEGAQ